MDNSDYITRHAVAYLRISDKKQIDGESPETQRRVIQDYAVQNNIKIIEWFYDEAKSGKNTDRKELQNLLQFATRNSKKVDLVIVYRLNRGSRDAMSYYTSVKAILAGKGIAIRSASEPMVDDSPIGRFLEGVIVLNGQLDNEIKGSTTIDNMRSLAMQGYWQHAPVLGYDKHTIANDVGKPRPTMKPNSMAPLVKQTLERFSKGDISPIDLMQYAAKIGLRTAHGKKLGKNGIYGLVRRPEYSGYIHDAFTDYKFVIGKHEPIISAELYEHNQKLLNKKIVGKQTYSRRNTTYPLKATLLCSGCNKPLYGSAPKAGSGKSHSPRYHCSRPECTKARKKSVGVQKTHEAYLSLLRNIQPSEGFLRGYKEILVRQAVRQNNRINTQVKAKRQELDDIASKRLEAIEESVGATERRKRELTEAIDSYDQKKLVGSEELDRLIEQQSMQEAKIDYAIRHMHNMAKQWLDADYDLRLRFQSMVFPEGTTLDMSTMNFGTDKISPLYRYVSNKKDLSMTEKSRLVPLEGFEPPASP